VSELSLKQVENCPGLTELDRRFRKPLNRYFRRRTCSSSDAEDLTQEVFLRLTKHEKNLTFENIEGLVYTIAANLLRDRWRSEGSWKWLQLAGIDEPIAAHPNLVEVLSPERVLLGKENLRLAGLALSELRERTQDVLILQRLEGMKNKEIAKALGISASAVEKHMARALTHMGLRAQT
jgi:RNA polymerase sigma-70 factor (ECF subfamily)